MSRHIVVTGAAGRVGRLLCDELRRAGCEVTGVDVAAGPEVQIVANLAQPSVELEDALATADGVVHLAALMSWDERRRDDIYTANVTGTLNLLGAIERSACRPRIVLASTGEVYPELAPVYLPIDEKHPKRPTSHYGLSKLMAEEAARFYARRTGAELVVLRFAHTQQASELSDPDSFFSGPRFFVSARIRRLRETQPMSAASEEAIRRLEAVEKPGQGTLLLARGPDGTPYRMGIADARDIVQGIRLALEHPDAPGEDFNIGPATAFSFDDVVPYMARQWGLEYVAVDLPLTPYQYETSVEKARRVLGYQPRFTIFDMVDAARPRVAESRSA